MTLAKAERKQPKQKPKGSDFMLVKTTVKKIDYYSESDAALSSKFSEAGFGLESGGKLLLHPLEACFLAQLGKTKFKTGSLASFIASQKKKDKNFPFASAIYSHIRGTGRIVRMAGASEDYLRVYAPGVGRTENRPSALLRLLPGATLSADLMKKEVSLAHLERLDLIIAIGTEKEPKYYKVSSFNF